MATFTVTTTADRLDPHDGRISLREAVDRANAEPGADTIRFAPAIEGETLTLAGGQLTLADDVTIDGGGSRVTLDGGGRDRVLLIGGSGMEVGLRHLTITGGDPRHDTPDGSTGGGIHVGAGNGLTLTGSVIAGNVGYHGGGGIFAGMGSRVTVIGSAIAGNRSDYGSGGGIGTAGHVTLEITQSELSGNRASDAGGGLRLQAGSSLVMERSTVSGNGSVYAGGIDAIEARVLLNESTIGGNHASFAYGTAGGVTSFGGELVIRNSTITGNRADSGPGTSGGGISARPITRLELANSIVAGNVVHVAGTDQPRALDITGRVTVSNGHNLFGSDVAGSAAGDREQVDPGLIFAAIDPATGGGRLALNGGPTATAALADSLANPALGGAEPVAADATDQRGEPRPQPGDSAPDIGAFELHQTALATTPSAGNDVLDGTPKADVLAGLAGSDRLSGGDGGDILRGGPGDDTLDGGGGQDTASYRDAGGGVQASLLTGRSAGALGVDRLVGIENLDGGSQKDALTGDDGANGLGGRLGEDALYGRGGDDHLLGHEGDDLLEGGRGRDTLTGGAGADRFAFAAVLDSPAGPGRDVIADFAAGDLIDLAGIDADALAPGNQAFRFVRTAALTGPAQIGCTIVEGATLVRGSVDADGAAELELRLDGIHALAAGDFLL